MEANCVWPERARTPIFSTNRRSCARDGGFVWFELYRVGAVGKRALQRGHATSRAERVRLNDLRDKFSRVIESVPLGPDQD
jgi:hypothetical protein